MVCLAYMPERDAGHLSFEPDRPKPLILTWTDWDLLRVLLSSDELHLIDRVEQGEVVCPECTQPVHWVMMISEVYEGITLVCLACGYLEY